MNKKENEMLQAQFERLCERGELFRSTVTGEQLWTAYMDGFGRDPVFLSPTSSVHNCRTCRRFIERYGNIVALDDEMRIITMWQGEGVSDEYRESFRRMDDLLRGSDISGVFVETFDFLKDGSGIVRELYGLQTCQFHAVSLVCLSPNYWQSEVGHKHYFFMLAGARAPKPFRGFHNEFLRPELLDHRKVMEVLGQTMRVESTDGQLSGLGFNATVRDDLVLRIDDGQQRIIRVQF